MTSWKTKQRTGKYFMLNYMAQIQQNLCSQKYKH